MSYIYDMTDTWNAAGTVFSAIKMNVTDSASAAGSKLIDLQLAGNSLFNVDKSGNVGVGTVAPGAKLDVAGPIKAGTANDVSLLMADNCAIRNTAAAGNTMYFDSCVGAGSTAGDFNFRSTASYTSRLYINGSTGNVGIGTSSPDAKLTIAGAAGTTESDNISITGRNPINHAYMLTGASSTSVDFLLGTQTAIPLVLWTNGSERARIDSSGNVGIGTGSPTAKLDVNADTVRVRTEKTPASATATGNAGDICWDANYVYVCVATNTWKRSALSTW